METLEPLTIAQKIEALININFFVGSLSDEGIEYYYNKLINELNNINSVN